MLPAFAIIASLQLLILALTTPMYEIDTNSFIRGGFSWDIFHNPFLNLYIAAVAKFFPNLWVLVFGQVLFFAFASAFLIDTLFSKRKNWTYWLAISVASLEPLSMFYNFSLLAESFFTAFTLLSVSFLIRWMRDGKTFDVLLFGLLMGLTFLTKLSAMIHLPLFALLLIREGRPFFQRVKSLGFSLIPYILCYLFVYFGQQKINQGDIYTVEGRVRWDFSSALYDSTIAGDPTFSRFVHPYIYADGKLVAHRELRRELSYLGYKDCVADYENRGFSANRGINACDSIFGMVAAKITKDHFWQAEKQFVADNFRFIHSLNYIDYRFTPDLHYYHPASEFQYIDSLMATHFGYDLSKNAEKIPRVWTSLDFGNIYMPIIWWIWWLAIGFAAFLWLRKRSRWELLVLGVLASIPLLFHFIYISYRPRFLAPYIILMLFLLVVEIEFGFGKKRNSAEKERAAQIEQL